MQIYQKLHSITGIFQRIWPQVQNNDIENYISVAASEDYYFLRTFLNVCFSKAAAKIFMLSFTGYTYFTFLPWRHVKEKRIFMDFF